MYPDLSRAITYRAAALNTLTRSLINGQAVIIGCEVTFFDISDVELRQFTEPFALTDGIDVGGVWKGARRAVMKGNVYDKTRGETYARLAALDALFLPESGTFGVYALTWYAIAGTTPTATLKTAQARPNGLRAVIQKDMHGGGVSAAGTVRDDMPLVIPWATSFFLKNPAIT